KGFHPVDADQLEGATRQTVEERQGHAIILAGASWHVKPGGGSNEPFTVAAKDPADRARGDADPKPAKLTLNANTSPAAVLPAESDDELDDLITKWRAPFTSL